jgi:hypothetical protein
LYGFLSPSFDFISKRNQPYRGASSKLFIGIGKLASGLIRDLSTLNYFKKNLGRKSPLNKLVGLNFIPQSKAFEKGLVQKSEALAENA